MKFPLAALFVTASSVVFAMHTGSEGGEVTAPEVPQGAPYAITFGDYDADGVNDIYALNAQGSDRLYRNAGDGTLVDVTVECGLEGVGGSRRAVFADWDADGLEDLLVLGSQGTRLFKNLGATFMDVTSRAGIQHDGVDLEAVWMDFDADGNADLYLEQADRGLLYRGMAGGVFELMEVTVPRPDRAPGGPVVTDAGEGGEEELTAPGAPGRVGAPNPNGPAPRPLPNTGPASGAPGRAGVDPASAGGGALDSTAGGGCASRILDSDGAIDCIFASTRPTDGMLFPLGEDFFIAPTTGKVGIGTLNPTRNLHVVGTPALGSILVAPDADTSGDSEIWFAEDRTGAERMGLRYDGGEEIIGDPLPTGQLEIWSYSGGTEKGPWMTVDHDKGTMGVTGESLQIGKDTGEHQDSAIWFREGVENWKMGWVYRGGPHENPGQDRLELMGLQPSSVNPDGNELGPWMTIDRDDGDVTFDGDVTLANVSADSLTAGSLTAGSMNSVSLTTDSLTAGSFSVSDFSIDNLITDSVSTDSIDVGFLSIEGDGVPGSFTEYPKIRADSIGLYLNGGNHGSPGDVKLNYSTGDDQGNYDTTIYGRTFLNNLGRDDSDSQLVMHNYDWESSYINCMVGGGSSAWTVFRVKGTGAVVCTGVTVSDLSGGGGDNAGITTAGRVYGKEVEVTGADLVEAFESSDGELEPGTVVVIDPEHPGKLKRSGAAYDAKVAGVVSGAGGVKHGIRLGRDSQLDGGTLVAMTGRVYVQCSTENGAIRAGDLLTTAATSGHAMKATDPTRSFGAVIGKAMSTLEEGEGLVLVLVSLQ